MSPTQEEMLKFIRENMSLSVRLKESDNPQAMIEIEVQLKVGDEIALEAYDSVYVPARREWGDRY